MSQLIPDPVKLTIKINYHKCSVQNMKWNGFKRTRCSVILLFPEESSSVFFILVHNWWLHAYPNFPCLISLCLYKENMERIWHLKDVQEAWQFLSPYKHDRIANLFFAFTFNLLFNNFILAYHTIKYKHNLYSPTSQDTQTCSLLQTPSHLLLKIITASN